MAPRKVVISAKHFDAMQGRAGLNELVKLAEIEENNRYNQYLMDGNNALVKQFKNQKTYTDEDNMRIDDEIKDSENRQRQLKMEIEMFRQKRILRAHNILRNMQPGQRALNEALRESDLIHQRKYNENLNRVIAINKLQQEKLDEKQCPQILIPFGGLTEQREQAINKEKAKDIREYFLKDLELRREQKLLQKNQNIYEAIVEREQYNCLHELEQRAARELRKSKQQACRQAYLDGLREKKNMAEYERTCEQIDNRIRCVDQTKQRNLKIRFNQLVKENRETKICQIEARAVEIYRQQQEKKCKSEPVMDKCEFMTKDDEQRQTQREELAKQRRDYQLVEQRQAEEKRQRDAQIRRFEVARRLKNQSAYQHFNTISKQQKNKVTTELRDVLRGQREEFLKQREAELMHTAACDEDPYLKEDVYFFSKAAKNIARCFKQGKPIYPLVKAVETYRRKNQIEIKPKTRLARNKLRDVCWPGYFSKANLAYKKYEDRENCHQKQNAERCEILHNCMRISEMASREQPYKPCPTGCPIKCFNFNATQSKQSMGVASNCLSEQQSKRSVKKDMPFIVNESMNKKTVSNANIKDENLKELKIIYYNSNQFTNNNNKDISNSKTSKCTSEDNQKEFVVIRSVAGDVQVNKKKSSTKLKRTQIWR